MIERLVELMQESMERTAAAVQAMHNALLPMAARIGDLMRIWDLGSSLTLEPAQTCALEAEVRRTARAACKALGIPTRISSLRMALRGRGVLNFDETTLRGHLVVTTGAEAPEGVRLRMIHLVLRPRLGADREAWALYLVALALLDPQLVPELAALDTVLRASNYVLEVSNEEAP